MKKQIVLVFLLFLGITYSCENTSIDPDRDPLIEDLEILIDDLKGLANDDFSSDGFLNYDNPLENLFIVYDETIIKSISQKKISKGDDLRGIFSEEFLSSFPAIDPDDLNAETFFIIRKLNQILVSYNINDCISRLKRVEDFIVKNHNRNLGYSDVLLSYSTFLRHALIIHSKLVDSKSEDETWKECMLRKLEEAQNCEDCWVEKTICVLAWPECLGVMAIDCGIAALL